MSEDCHNSEPQPAPQQIAQPLRPEFDEDDLAFLAALHIKGEELD